MVISVVDMITEARAQIELVTPEAVSKELAAALATLTLQSMGYDNVADMDGGIKAWIAADLPTVEHHGDI